MSSIDVNIRSRSITVSIGNITGATIRTVENITITPGAETIINTGQSTQKPRLISLYDRNGKRIDKNMGEPTVFLSTNYIITYASQLIPYSNVTLYYQ